MDMDRLIKEMAEQKVEENALDMPETTIQRLNRLKVKFDKDKNRAAFDFTIIYRIAAACAIVVLLSFMPRMLNAILPPRVDIIENTPTTEPTDSPTPHPTASASPTPEPTVVPAPKFRENFDSIREALQGMQTVSDSSSEALIENYMAFEYSNDMLAIGKSYIFDGYDDYEDENMELAFFYGSFYYIENEKLKIAEFVDIPILVQYTDNTYERIDNIEIPDVTLTGPKKAIDAMYGDGVYDSQELAFPYSQEKFTERARILSTKISETKKNGGFDWYDGELHNLYLDLWEEGYYGYDTIEQAIESYFADNYNHFMNMFAVATYHEFSRETNDDITVLYIYANITHIDNMDVNSHIGGSGLYFAIHLKQDENDKWQVIELQEVLDGTSDRDQIFHKFSSVIDNNAYAEERAEVDNIHEAKIISFKDGSVFDK